MKFHPFQKVLVKPYENAQWCLALYSHKSIDTHYTVGGIGYKECVPYKTNEHLLGTVCNLVRPVVPNPGSDEAIRQGCLCPVLDNGHGKGMIQNGKQVFWINVDCPLHGKN